MGVGFSLHWLAGWPGPRPCQEAQTALELARAGDDALLATAKLPSQEERTEGHVIH